MANIEHIKIYFGLYYTMTGLHGAHVLIGMGLITWILYRAIAKDEFGPKYFTPVEGVGLFWHIIDLIWIFLFPLFYLT
jgi:cytochrome c oxidase subunit 3